MHSLYILHHRRSKKSARCWRKESEADGEKFEQFVHCQKNHSALSWWTASDEKENPHKLSGNILELRPGGKLIVKLVLFELIIISECFQVKMNGIQYTAPRARALSVDRLCYIVIAMVDTCGGQRSVRLSVGFQFADNYTFFSHSFAFICFSSERNHEKKQVAISLISIVKISRNLTECRVGLVLGAQPVLNVSSMHTWNEIKKGTKKNVLVNLSVKTPHTTQRQMNARNDENFPYELWKMCAVGKAEVAAKQTEKRMQTEKKCTEKDFLIFIHSMESK